MVVTSEADSDPHKKNMLWCSLSAPDITNLPSLKVTFFQTSTADIHSNNAKIYPKICDWSFKTMIDAFKNVLNVIEILIKFL